MHYQSFTKQIEDTLGKLVKDDRKDFLNSIQKLTSKAGESAERIGILLFTLMVVFILIDLQMTQEGSFLGLKFQDLTSMRILIPVVVSYTYLDFIVNISKIERLSKFYKILLAKTYPSLSNCNLADYFVYIPSSPPRGCGPTRGSSCNRAEPLVRSRDLQLSEAALTGESLPVEKDALAMLPHDIALAERRNMAYTSTLVTYGSGSGVVVATGDNTEIGRISQLISSAENLETPLTQKMAACGRILMVAILALAALAIAVGILRGQPAADTVSAGIALAVAAIPEGLPAVITICLAVGVRRMAERHAVVRHLPAVETLGSTSVICSDKTGTLTRNEMTVQVAWLAGHEYRFSGIGYAPRRGNRTRWCTPHRTSNGSA